jgi:AcrR family transcriptional regulator
MKKPKPPKRRRNAASTRDAILASARLAFMDRGFDGAGVRDIAAGAGVTAMLVNRYFGSKERLFAEVIAVANAKPVIASPEILNSPTRAREIAEALVEITTPGGTVLDGFLIMMRSFSSPRAIEIARQEIEKQHQKNVAAALSGRSASQRAALLLGLVAGVQMMRQMIELEALSKAKPKQLEELLTPLIQSLVDE